MASSTGGTGMAEADIESVARRRHAAAIAELRPEQAILLLHIGDQHTILAHGSSTTAVTILQLNLGFQQLADACFQHHPASAAELEHAIQVVEDQLARARALTGDTLQLASSDPELQVLATVAGVTGTPLRLTAAVVEQTFARLAALAEGIPATSAGIPTDHRFAASVLILRELMHHLHFAAITVLA